MDITGTGSISSAASGVAGAGVTLRNAGSAGQKLTPNQDLQCYYFMPSAIAAVSQASADGFTVSGCWRQQGDWAVVEWNRDNVFEHPVFRNLPDADLSGLHLSYDEVRTNCIVLDSTLFASVDWPYLRVWADPGDGTGEHIYWIPLKDHATPAAGSYATASATFTLGGTYTKSDYVELICNNEHYTYQFYGVDTLANAVTQIATAVNGVPGVIPPSTYLTAKADGETITLTDKTPSNGANGNRIGVYGNATGGETWTPVWQFLSGGVSPRAWHIDLDFSDPNLQGHVDKADGPMTKVPMKTVRKMRWTWAADLQPGNFQRSEFSVAISNWNVTGTGRAYQVAGPGSWRVEDDDESLVYAPAGAWTTSLGNYSGCSIHSTTTQGASVTLTYTATYTHTLYLGTRRSDGTASATVVVDGAAPQNIITALSSEDVLVRISLGAMAAGSHTIVIRVASGGTFWFDFLEMAVPATAVPVFVANSEMTLATDWDTLHSQAIAPERTAWLIYALGFAGRANHYVGALWWYELVNAGQYSSAKITFSGTTSFGATTNIMIGATAPTTISHLNYVADTPDSVAKAFELLINGGATAIWALASGADLTITSRTLGTAGNLTVQVTTGSAALAATVSTTAGVDAPWLTDLAAAPRINRAARDWSSAFFRALNGYGIDATAALSLELGNGDTSTAAGIAQRYPDGSPCMLNTPALQTNFSPTSLAFWQEAYAELAGLQAAAGLVPYLQFGEVQWWYFCPPTDPAHGNWTPILNGGMPFYDAYTTGTFQTQYGTAMHVFTDPSNDPSAYPNESAFLPGLVGEFISTIQAYVRGNLANTRFEVLYPPDTNDAPLTAVINLPATWTPANLDCFKTENFTYTGNRNLNKAQASISLPVTRGFPLNKTAHLVGIMNYSTPWEKESRLATGEKLSSVVLFALDQFCLIGYGLPLSKGPQRSLFMG